MKIPLKRFAVRFAVCAAFAVWIAVLYAQNSPRLRQAEFFFQDWFTQYGRKTAIDPNLVFIGIDRPAYEFDLKDEDISQEPVLAELKKTFPWSRDVWATLLERLVESGAKVVAVDLVFAASSEHDERLKEVLKKYQDRIVVGANFLNTKMDDRDFRSLQYPGASLIDRDGEHYPIEDRRVGLVNMQEDDDGVIRRFFFRRTGADLYDVLPPNVVAESLAARTVRSFGRPEVIPAGTEAKRLRYTAPPGTVYREHPVGIVLSPSMWKRNYGNGEFFRNKIVLIGPTAPIFQDQHLTPLGTMAGPEIHLNVINATLQHEFLPEMSRSLQQSIIALFGVVSLGLGIWAQQPLRRLAVMIVVGLGYIGLALLLFNQSAGSAMIVPVAAPLLVLLPSCISVLAYDYFLERRDKRRIRKTLERYVSKDVVKEVLDNPETYLNSLVGVRKPVTVLFSDVRGFTTLTESADSAALVKQLNEYFEEMVRLVFNQNGRLDKFIGDAVMADWGSIVTAGKAVDAQRAVATALAMKKALPRLNADWKTRGMMELAFGIGINQGDDVILGNLGSEQKMEVSVIGDAVNLASRLEGLTKEYHLDLLLGETVAPLVKEKFILRTVDSVQVKGKTRPVDVFTVVGELNGSGDTLPWLAAYENGVKLYRGRKFAEGVTAFEESLRLQANDYLTEMYLTRCREFVEHPPGPDWDGTHKMTKK